MFRRCLSIVAILMSVPLGLPAADPLPTHQRRLYIMGADGKQVRRLLDSPEKPFDNCGFPSWSPDCSRIVFDAVRGTSRMGGRIYVLHLTGETPGQIEDLGPGITPDWSPDGTQIAFFMPTDQVPGQSTGTYVMQIDGTGRRKVSEHKFPRWSPNGEFLVCTPRWTTCEELHIVDLRTLEDWPLAIEGLKFHGRGDFAADPTRLVVTIDYPDAKSSVAELDVSTRPPVIVRQVLTPLRMIRQPTLSPDGQQVVGDMLLPHGESRLAQADLVDRSLRFWHPEKQVCQFGDPAWSPDGRHIAFAGYGFDDFPPYFKDMQPSDLSIWRRSSH